MRKTKMVGKKRYSQLESTNAYLKKKIFDKTERKMFNTYYEKVILDFLLLKC